MSSPPPPPFGKRTALQARATPSFAPPQAIAAVDHAAFFAEMRREMEPAEAPRVVPRSFLAALLAGLVVGLCLAGIDVTRASATVRQLATLTNIETSRVLPFMILLALLGGARAAATSLLIAHWVLSRMGWTHHEAYALAGGAVAAVFVLAELALVHTGLIDGGMLPGHGLAIDTAAGAGAGFLYRVFAGSRPA